MAKRGESAGCWTWSGGNTDERRKGVIRGLQLVGRGLRSLFGWMRRGHGELELKLKRRVLRESRSGACTLKDARKPGKEKA